MDKNLHSFIGPDDDNRSILINDTAWPLPSDYSSAIKITGKIYNFMVQGEDVPGGRDAVVDINNKASKVTVVLARPQPRGQFLVTCKGGAKDVHLSLHNILAHGSVTDIILDDWSDQSHEPTVNITLDCTMQDGSPVRILALKNRPNLTHGQSYSFPWWTVLNVKIGSFYLIGSFFEILRRIGFFRKQAN